MRHECYFYHLKTVEEPIDKFQRKAADLFIRTVNLPLYHKQGLKMAEGVGLTAPAVAFVLSFLLTVLADHLKVL